MQNEVMTMENKDLVDMNTGRLPKPYTTLFNGMTDAIDELEKAIERMKFYQQLAEELFICEDDT